VPVVVASTTDVHGWILGWDYEVDEPAVRGLSLLAPLIDSLRQVHPGRTVLLDAGDFLQGNILAGVHASTDALPGHPVVAAMNHLRYDGVAIGNHEFNFGLPFLEAALDEARFPTLAANLYLAGTEEPAFHRWTMVERTVEGRPLRIGVTSVTPPGILVWDRDHLAGRIDARPILPALSQVVPEMRAAGAHLVVVAGHGGLEGTSYDTLTTELSAENVMAEAARSIPGIDLIVMGHTHRTMADTVIGGTLLVQAGNWAGSLSVATLEMRPRGRDWEVVSKRGETLVPDPGRSDPGLAGVVAAGHRRARDWVQREVGQTPDAWSATEARIRDTAIIDLINEVQLRETGAQLSAASAFNLAAGFGPGPISLADLARLYPYDNNTLRAVRISGADLEAYLERAGEYFLPCPESACERLVNTAMAGYNFDIVAGVDYTLDITRPVGDRVTRLLYRGRPVAESDSFTIALNNYRQGGGGGFPAVADAPVVYSGEVDIRSLIRREIERRGILRQEDVFRENWEIVPSHLLERALMEQARGGR
jgi:2',3'-cyclic-nucleotide 2'-phosphodiesterase (5'-nucleotidase family)